MDDTATSGNVVAPVRKYPLTKKRCLEIGGHCFEISPFVMASNPPTYERVCKHCGLKQRGRPQPDMDWNDIG